MVTTKILQNVVCGLLFIVVASCAKINPVSCNYGWFGDNCQFQCHCSEECDIDGECSLCADGYFGPGCQYEDYASRLSSDETLDFIYDEDDLTCNDDPDVTSLIIDLNKEISLYWLRLIFSPETEFSDITITPDSKYDGCKQTQIYLVNDKTVDVLCFEPIFTKRVTLYGEMLSTVCTIYISGGRNVAWKQLAKQSTTLRSLGPEKALDGLINTYSSTLHGTKQWWVISFDHLIMLLLINVHKDSSMKNDGYILRTYNEADEVVMSIREDGMTLYSFHEMFQNKSELIKSVRIESTGQNPLALVEVEIYAEMMCPDDVFGIACNKPCKCSIGEQCHFLSGLCSEECINSYGLFCDKKCSQTCLDTKCKPRSGNCVQCRYGRRGKLCTEECQDGTYGYNCSHQCSQSCKGLCDKVSGDCFECEEYHYGPKCTACPKNTHGEDCSVICPENCKIDKCNITSGECLRCEMGFSGVACTECPYLSYGFNCSSVCAATCLNGCNKVTGQCHGCKVGNTGQYCSRQIIYKEGHTPVTIVSFGLLISFLPFCMFLRKKKMDTQKSESLHSSTTEP